MDWKENQLPDSFIFQDCFVLFMSGSGIWKNTLKYFVPFSRKGRERRRGCLNTWGGDEQGLSCESLKEEVNSTGL